MSTPEDARALRQDKYGGDPEADIREDLKRLDLGEPLAYVVGWLPFLGLRIELDSRPLIPRPETEWWTEKLIEHLNEKFSDQPFILLDLCAGSGAIGLSVLAKLPEAHATFAEVVPAHVEQIRKNLEVNGLDLARATIIEGDLFENIPGTYDVIATNPPYVPESRALPESVTLFEPPSALYGGDDGLSFIRRIASEARRHLNEGGQLWLECDSEHAETAQNLLKESGAQEALLHKDQYGRPRLLVSYW